MHGRERLERFQQRCVGDVARVQNDVGLFQLRRDFVEQPRRLTGTEMGVGQQQGTDGTQEGKASGPTSAGLAVDSARQYCRRGD